MTADRKPNRPGMSFYSSTIGLQGDTLRQKSTLRAGMLENNNVGANMIFGTTPAIRESIEEAFGRTDALHRKLN